MKKILALVSSVVITLGISSNVFAKDGYQVKRLYGNDRYKTSFNIAKEFSDGKVSSIIVASGNDFPDALTGSVLSKQLNAPIVLSDNSLSDTSECINYIKNHLDKDGKIYILGGNASVKNEFVSYMNGLGYNNITRLGGQDRFDTNKIIVNSMKVEKGTPVVIANAYGFADALSVSSIASLKGYPILMTSKEKLSDSMKKVIEDVQPKQVYIIGGQGSVGDNVVAQLKGIVGSISDNDIIRLGGQDRYETSMKVCSYFDLNTDTAVVANGENFPDALSGSALASKLNAPVMLTNGLEIEKQKEYMDNKNYKNLYLIGGPGVMDLATEYTLKGKLATQQEKDSVDQLLIGCKNYLDVSRSELQQANKISKDMEEALKNMVNSKNLVDMENSFNKFMDIYTNAKENEIKFKQSLVNIRGTVEKVDVPDNLLILKNTYIGNINLDIDRVDKGITLMDNYINWSKSVLDLVKANNVEKLKNEFSKIEKILNDASNLGQMKNGQVPIGNIGLKLVEIKNAINPK